MPQNELITRLGAGGQSGRAATAEKALERMREEGLVGKPFVPKKRSFAFPPVDRMGCANKHCTPRRVLPAIETMVSYRVLFLIGCNCLRVDIMFGVQTCNNVKAIKLCVGVESSGGVSSRCCALCGRRARHDADCFSAFVTRQRALSIEKLTHGYQDRMLFDNTSLEIEKGERVAVIGVLTGCQPLRSSPLLLAAPGITQATQPHPLPRLGSRQTVRS